MDKAAFLKNDYVPLLATINPEIKGLFGKMNVQQMIEHMGYAFRQASGLITLAPTNNVEITNKMYRFMMSDKPFRENTPNVFLPETPLPLEHSSVGESLSALKKEIEHFVSVFAEDTQKRILNPFFGNLNFDEWVHLLYKHGAHHARQFGLNSFEGIEDLEIKTTQES